MPESKQQLTRDDLVVYVTHSQHRWEKHGEDDVLAIDIQCKVNDQEDWVPLLADLLGWTEKQVEAFCQLATASFGAKEYAWSGEFVRHRVDFMTIIGGDERTVHTTIWEGKINKFRSTFKDAEMSFRVQGTIPDEEVAGIFIGLEHNLVSLRISPLQGDMFGTGPQQHESPDPESPDPEDPDGEEESED